MGLLILVFAISVLEKCSPLIDCQEENAPTQTISQHSLPYASNQVSHPAQVGTQEAEEPLMALPDHGLRLGTFPGHGVA